MQEVFEKIIEKLEDAKSNVPVNRLLDDIIKDKPKELGQLMAYNKSIEIVKQAVAEYYKENYFNLDHAALHKCPKCGADAEHRVNKKGSWACGCFQCNLFKTSYDHGKAIQAWEDFCSDNNGWIPCSDRLPKYGEVVMCSCTNSGITISCITHKGVKPSKSVRFGQHSVIAWQPLPAPYQPKCKIPKTNADRIRSMTDDELANENVYFASEFVAHQGLRYTGLDGHYYRTGAEVVEANMKWLQSEVEESDER